MNSKYQQEDGSKYSQIVAEGNRLKVKAGADFAEAILDLLEQLKESGVVKNFRKEVHFSHDSMAYAKQYLANYVVETYDSKIIIVRSSTSFRNDRAKIGLYDLQGISVHGNVAQDIIASIYLVQDTELNNKTFLGVRKKVEDGEYYCPATHLLCLSEFVDFLNEYKYAQEFDELIESSDSPMDRYSKLESNVEQGSYLGKQGNDFEKELVEILSITSNLQSLKSDKTNCNSQYAMILEKICSVENIELDEVVTIIPSNKITLLNSGGNAKTDISIEFLLADGMRFTTTVSVKNTKASSVTCHDYKAADFIRVLECEDTELSKYLELFQKHPSYSGFEEHMVGSQSLNEFVLLLSEKHLRLCEWALMGKHDTLNLVDPETQISNYIFIKNWETKEYSFCLMEEYLNIIRNERMQKFGVPFAWTYPSKRRGERIQLKLPIVLK